MKLYGFKIKLFLLRQDDGANPESFYDFSDNVQVGFGQTLNLDDTIDTMNLTLTNLTFSKRFEPTSMFRVVITQPFKEDGKISYYEKQYDFALQQDDVEQPNMAENLFTHNLSLANPAIVAQQKTVDDVAVTYKLQDVTLETDDISSIDFNSYNVPKIDSANMNPSWYPIKNRNFGLISVDHQTSYNSRAYRYRYVYPVISYPQNISEQNRAIETLDYNFTDIKNIKENYLYGDGENPIVVDGVSYPTANHITFNVPLIRADYGELGTRNYKFLGFLPTDIEIIDENVITGVVAPPIRLTAYPSKYIDVGGETEIENATEVSQWNGTTQGQTYETRDYYRDIQNINIGYSGALPSGVIVAQKEYIDDDILVYDSDLGKYIVKNRTITINFEPNEIHKISIKIKRHQFSQMDNFYDQSGARQMNKSKTPNPYVIAQETKVLFWTQQKINERLDDNIAFEMNFGFSYFPHDSYVRELFHKAKQIDAYYLFNKAQLCVVPRLKESGVAYYNSDLPFIVSEADKTLLERTLLIESDFVGKNLWEVFSEIGKYIHAKPRIKIDTDDNDNMTGKYIVEFLYYGKPEINEIEETSNTIFNSRFAQEYICELDSYVENYFNLGSYITEKLHISSDSYDELIYNDVCKLITKYPILEILRLQVSNTQLVVHDITKYVFEYNIYKTLDYDVNKVPSKHRAIYYHLGTNIIEGMQFVTPAPTGVENAYAMKNIIASVFGVSADNVNVNDYVFQLDYRIKDNVRVSITRPDLRKYLLNSKYDPFPIHAQFNQQQDKLVSSDNFGLNAYGKLIRTGNTTYNLYNWTNDLTKTMNEGDLYSFNNNLYYVSKVSRIYYAEHIEENVELSKDFNRLSQIIGIPSQPRFYEISERNIVNRNIKFNEYIQVSATKYADYVASGRLSLSASTCVNAMFSSVYIPDGVVSIFKGDKDKEYDELSNNMVYQVYTPLVSYSSKNTLTLEWDMEDNFSAGDCSSPVLDEYGNEKTLQWGLNLYSIINLVKKGNNTPQQAYRSKMPVRYVDTYGRADLFDYIFTKNYSLTFSQIRDLPSTDISTKSASAIGCIGGSNDNACWNIRKQSTFNEGVAELLSNDKGYIIAKDNRERLSFNYNAQLILDSDRIVLGNKLWMRDLTNSKVRIVLLDVELNKFDSDTVNVENVIAATSPIAYNDILTFVDIADTSFFYYLDIESNMSSFTYEQKESCKSYAVVRADMVGAENNTNNYRIIIGKNVSDYMDLVEKFTDFEFGAYDKSSALTNRKQLDILSN